MTGETRRKIAEQMYAEGNREHPYVKEFIAELEPKPAAKADPNKVKRDKRNAKVK